MPRRGDYSRVETLVFFITIGFRRFAETKRLSVGKVVCVHNMVFQAVLSAGLSVNDGGYFFDGFQDLCYVIEV